MEIVENKEPLAVVITNAQNDLTTALISIQSKYNLPAYLMNLIATATIAEIRGCANVDLLKEISNVEKEKKEE